jgi:hypothetical protein
MNTKHCSENFNNYSVQISLFSYIHLTPLKPSTSLTPHQPFPLSLCCWKPARFFTALLQALSLVSTRIGRWWTPESLAILPLSHCGMAPSPSAGRQLYRCENDSTAIRCLTVGWLPCYLLTTSPWKDFLTIRCFAVRRLSQSLLAPYPLWTSCHG